jgi:1,4-alpha-glucan branching enzyme
VLVTGESDGYYADYADQPRRLFGRALAEGFAYQGEASAYRHGDARGTPSAHLPPQAFVNAAQTHDQVGNRAFGERMAALAAAAGREDALRALMGCMLLAPAPPMLFMGEEYAASTPFLYFCDYAGELARAVTQGRRAEFARFARFADPGARESIPDPNDPATFERSKLDRAERERAPHARWLAWYARLLQLRRDQLLPLLQGAASGHYTLDAECVLHVWWPLGEEHSLHQLVNLGDRPARAPPPASGRRLYATHAAGEQLAPWSLQVWLDPT